MMCTSRLTVTDFQAMSWKFTMPKQKWLRYAMEDPGLLHSVLFIASAHYSVAKTTVPGLSIDARRHAAATISIIKRRMMDPVQRCSDATIGAIGRVITWSVSNYSLPWRDVIVGLIHFRRSSTAKKRPFEST